MGRTEHEAGYGPGTQAEAAKLAEVQSEENRPPLPTNGLLYPVDLEDKRAIEPFKFVVKKMVAEMGGVQPRVEVVLVENTFTGGLLPRVIVNFEREQLSDKQLEQLEEVARRVYGSG